MSAVYITYVPDLAVPGAPDAIAALTEDGHHGEVYEVTGARALTFTTAVLSLFVIGLAVANRGTPPAMWYLGGALACLVGTFLVTGLGNVPLNDRLAAAEADAVPVWEHYLSRWTRLNTIRTFAAVAAALSFTIGLLHAG